jgi:hypothetical protein
MPEATPRMPSLGRIVLYGDESGAAEHPAIVTGVDGDRVNLQVFFDLHGIQVRRGVKLNPDPLLGHQPETWRWPPRV